MHQLLQLQCRTGWEPHKAYRSWALVSTQLQLYLSRINCYLILVEALYHHRHS